jgi:hypothetical protein
LNNLAHVWRKIVTTKKPNPNHKQIRTPALNEEARAAFERMRPRLAAVAPDGIVRTNLAATRAIGVVIAAQPKIAELISDFEEQLPMFPVASIDTLRDLAFATYYALHRAAPDDDEAATDGPELEALVHEGTDLRQTLQLEAEALARRKLLPPDHVAALRGGRGYANLADGLVGLSTLLRDHWSAIESKTAATQADIARAQTLSLDLVERIGTRVLAENRAATRGDGHRALTLLVQTYDEIRAAVLYLRRKERDGNAIAPSLYAGRGRRRAVVEAESAVTEAPAPLEAPAPSGPSSVP